MSIIIRGNTTFGPRIIASSYGVLTNAWITATGETDVTILSALNTLESDLNTYGLTSKIKALYPFVGGTAAKHKYNFMDARDLDAAFRLVFNGGWTHSSTGALPNGTNAYADTKLNENSELNLNDAHISIYSRTNLNALSSDIGAIDSSNKETNLFPRYAGNFYARIQALNNNTVSSSSSLGFFCADRIQSSEVISYVNGTLTYISNTSIGKVNLNLYLGALNNQGTAAFYSSRELAFSSIGYGLSSTNLSDLYTAVQAFQTTLSRNV